MRYLVTALFLSIVLSGCGSNGNGQVFVTRETYYAVDGPTVIKHDTCTAYEVKRFTQNGTAAAMPQDFPIQPGLVSGVGGLFADADCTKLAKLNIFMLAGKNAATFYFVSPVEGVSIIEAGDILTPKESRGVLSIVVQ